MTNAFTGKKSDNNVLQQDEYPVKANNIKGGNKVHDEKLLIDNSSSVNIGKQIFIVILVFFNHNL